MSGSNENQISKIRNIEKATSIELLLEISKTTEILNSINERFYKRFELTQVQFKALLLLYAATTEGITLSSMSEEMEITRPTVTSLVDRLVSAELAKRTTNIEDRRSIRVVITDKGKGIMKEVLPNNEVFKLSILDFLTDTEIQKAYELILKVKQGLIEKYLKDTTS